MAKRQNEDEKRVADAMAKLDQMRHEAGGALPGWEVRKRAGLDPHGGSEEAPPLDWRMTPKNIVLQVLAIALFIAVVWFIVTTFFGGIGALLNR